MKSQTPHPLLTLLLAVFFNLITLNPAANAGVFTLTQFVEQHNWSLGLEPEVTLTNDSGFAVDAKFTYGITSLSNLQFGMGPGSGRRQFRIGGAYTLDFIPDLDGQVGTGIALQGYVYKLRYGVTSTELTLVPYVHKSFDVGNGTSVDPYFSLPLGMSLANGEYKGITQAVFGSFFKLTPNFSYSLELGLNLVHSNPYSDSYIAGGIIYTN